MRTSILVLALTLVGLRPSTSLAAGRLEEIRSRFNEVQEAFNDTKESLRAGDTNSGVSNAESLLSSIGGMCSFVPDVKDRIQAIPSLQPAWQQVSYWCVELPARVMTLKSKIGNEDTSGPLSQVEEGFLKLGDSLKAAYDQFNEFGKNWQVICETCR
jgi:hypothetical protein